jgi:DNA-binding transcriptional LysR family regulator
LELRHLQHFIAVAEEQNFTRAAARLHIVQSGLPVSIRTLERELGSALFERTSHKVLLTDAGSAFLAEARKVLAAADNARHVVAAVQGGVRGTVRVGIMQSMVLVDLAELLARFRDQRPFVRIEPCSL